MLNRLYITTKAPRVSTSPHRALLRMLKVEWGMLNSHSSSLSLAGVRRACPALKPDAADQVLLKNRAGFAAFSKGRAFHRCLEQDRCAGDREAGTGGAIRMHRAHEQCGHTAGWRGLTVGDAGITRRLSETYSADYLTCPQDSPGVFSLSEGLRPSRCRRAIRAGRTHGPCVPTAGMVGPSGHAGIRVAGAVYAYGWMALRVLSSRDAAGYARRGISLLMLLHCRFSRVRVVFSMFSLLHFGFGPRCSSRYARRRTGGRTGRASLRILGCTCRGMRGLASAVASAVDCPDSSRL